MAAVQNWATVGHFPGTFAGNLSQLAVAAVDAEKQDYPQSLSFGRRSKRVAAVEIEFGLLRPIAL